nr:unnamed protein product [Callosobruchus analis]
MLLDEIPSDPESEEDISDNGGGENIYAQKTLWTTSSLKCLQNVNNFAKRCGSNVSDQIETPTDVFLQVFPESSVELIVFQITLYGFQKHRNISAFKATNIVEIRAFLTINLLMGIKKYPSYRDY